MRTVRRSLLIALAVATTFAAVGLTAPVESLFSIVVHPVLWRVDAASDQPHTTAFGLDLDVTLGELRMHVGWSALPLSWPTGFFERLHRSVRTT